MERYYEKFLSMMESLKEGKPVQVLLHPDAHLIQKNCIKKPYNLDAMTSLCVNSYCK